MRFKKSPCDKCDGKVRDTQPGRICHSCVENRKRTKIVLEDAIRNVLLDSPDTKRVETLVMLGEVLKELSDETKLKSLIEEQGEERIVKAREVMDEAMEEFANCFADDHDAALDAVIDAMSEYDKLCEALTQLEMNEEAEAEEE